MEKQPGKNKKQTLTASAAGAVGGLGAALGTQYADGVFRESEEGENATHPNSAESGALQAGEIGNEKVDANTINVSQDNSAEDDEIIEGIAFDANGDGVEDAMAYDLNGDGVIDAVAIGIDTDADGVMDAVAVAADTNGDGVMDVVQMDLNGDGVLDALAMDYDQDGIMEYAGVDTDGDHVVESHFVDTNADRSYDLMIRDYVSGDYNDGADAGEYDAAGDDIAYDMDNDAEVSDWA